MKKKLLMDDHDNAFLRTVTKSIMNNGSLLDERYTYYRYFCSALYQILIKHGKNVMDCIHGIFLYSWIPCLLSES